MVTFRNLRYPALRLTAPDGRSFKFVGHELRVEEPEAKLVRAWARTNPHMGIAEVGDGAVAVPIRAPRRRRRRAVPTP